MKKLVNGILVDLSIEDVAEYDARTAAFEAAQPAIIADQKRQAALAAKWIDPFTLIDDILVRGIDSVKAERDAIKAANPKIINLEN